MEHNTNTREWNHVKPILQNLLIHELFKEFLSPKVNSCQTSESLFLQNAIILRYSILRVQVQNVRIFFFWCNNDIIIFVCGESNIFLKNNSFLVEKEKKITWGYLSTFRVVVVVVVFVIMERFRWMSMKWIRRKTIWSMQKVKPKQP